MDNVYMPRTASIVDIQHELPDVRTFSLRFASGLDQESFHYKPGQFIELSMLGVGEAPFSISSSPSRRASFDITVKAVGSVTQALHAESPGALVGVRGPYGNGFPLDELAGKDVLFV